MAADKREYPKFFPARYNTLTEQRLGIKSSYSITLSGDPETPMVKHTDNGLSEQGLQKPVLAQVLKTRNLSINLPSKHLNSDLVTSLLKDILPLSKFLQSLTIKFTDSPQSAPSLTRHQEIFQAFRDFNPNITAFNFVDMDGGPIEVDVAFEKIIFDDTDGSDVLSTSDGNIDVNIDDKPKSFADIFARNSRLKNDRQRNTDSALGITALSSGGGALFIGTIAIGLIDLWFPWTDCDGIKQPARFGTSHTIGFAVTFAALTLAFIGFGVAWLMRQHKQQDIVKQRSVYANANPNLTSSIAIDLHEHSLAKAVSVACREEPKKTKAEPNQRYQIEYWHPRKGMVRTELLTWADVQTTANGLLIPAAESSKIDIKPDYQVYYHLPVVASEIGAELISDHIEDEVKNPRREWLTQRQEFVRKAKSRGWIGAEGCLGGDNAEGIAVLFAEDTGASYIDTTAPLRESYAQYKRAKQSA